MLIFFENLLITLIVFSLPIAHAEEVTWLVLTLPGSTMQQAGKPDEGFINDAQRLLEAQLPEFTHQHERSTHKRLDRDLAGGRPICSTLTLEHPDRSKKGYFVVYLPALPMELVSRSALLPALALDNGKVSLAKLLRTSLKGGIASTRGYPPELADLIQTGIENGRIEVINTSSPGVNLIAMIAHARLDYTIEFPVVTTELSRAASTSTLLVSLSIAENQRLVPTGIYCTRSAWGRQMAARVNAAIQRLAQKPEPLLQLYSESQRAAYELRIRAFFRARTTASPDY